MIDFHCHIWLRGYLPEKFWTGQESFFTRWYAAKGEKIPSHGIDEVIFSQYWDPDGEKTLASMDEAGIEKAVLLPIDFGFSEKDVAIPIEVHNEDMHRIARVHPGRFIPFIGIDPRRKNAFDLLRRGVEDWGVRGIKYYGVAGFFPGEEKGLSLLEWAEKQNLILLIHQGPLFPPFESDYAHPRHLEFILQNFPKLRVVAAHMAFAWWRDIIKLGKEYSTLYADISAWQLVLLDNSEKFKYILRKMIDGMGIDRILFGTDGPTFDSFVTKKSYSSFIKNLPQGNGHPAFHPSEIHAILHGNANRLLE
jgi:uncharacterized protein